MKIVLIDNYDSFTYNLALLVREVYGARPVVVQNDRFEIDNLEVFDKILLSPGPGIPADAGLLTAVIERYAATKSILGICLGHQAIASVFGASLVNLTTVFHGLSTPINKLQEDPLLDHIPARFNAGRYHSWVADRHSLPDELEVLAADDEGHIMALAHRKYDVKGLQFHPESIMTDHGKTIIDNWINAKR